MFWYRCTVPQTVPATVKTVFIHVAALFFYQPWSASGGCVYGGNTPDIW